jgi:hypothetical protein
MKNDVTNVQYYTVLYTRLLSIHEEILLFFFKNYKDF